MCIVKFASKLKTKSGRTGLRKGKIFLNTEQRKTLLCKII